MNKLILLKRKYTPIRFQPIQISVQEEEFVKFATSCKETMQKSMGVPIIDAECPVSNAMNEYNIAIAMNEYNIAIDRKEDDVLTPREIRFFQIALSLTPTGIMDEYTRYTYDNVKAVHDFKNSRDVMKFVYDRLDLSKD